MPDKRPPASTIALVVTVLYGLTIALLAALDVPAMSVVALVGALVLGAMWALIGLLGRRDKQV